MESVEKTFIGVCLLFPEKIDEAVLMNITPDYLISNEATVLYDGILTRRREGKPIDNVWAMEYLKHRTGNACAVEIADCIGDIVHKHQFATAVEQLIDRHQRRRLTQLFSEAHQRLQANSPHKVLEYMRSEMNKTLPSAPPEQDVVAMIRKRLDKDGVIQTGIPKLTWMTKGIEEGVLWVLGGWTSHCKTQLSLNIALEVARQDTPVTIFSTEMDETALVWRLATIVSGINPSLMESITDEEKDGFMASVAQVKTLPIHVCKTLSLSNIRISIRQKKSCLYVVDYIQMICPDKDMESDVKRLGYIVRELELMSKEYNSCVIATSQFNRPLKKDGETAQPTLSNYRGSGEIEENTDIGLLLYYPYQMASFDRKKKLAEQGEDRLLQLCVSKNRIHGLTGVIDLDFDRNTMRIKEML